MNLEQVGPFRITKPLGNKRQRVFAAQHMGQDRTVAIKLIGLPPDVSRDDALKRIHKEVRFLNRLSHPHLVQLHGGGVSNDRIYLEMELVPGESLASLLSRRGRLAWDLAVDYAVQIAEVLDYLHKKDLLHSKLTPEKILIHDGQIKVTDLRLNRSRRRRWDVKRHAELDVAAYLAPEQILGEGATAQSDLYSLGVIMYEMVMGQLPYPPESLRQMAIRKQKEPIGPISQTIVEAPTWLDQVVETLMHPNPDRRYPSALAALLALREIQKIDAQKISSVAQMAGGFNPLTAGSDKREARLLLGRPDISEVKLTKKTPPRKVPEWAKVAALLVVFALCSTVIGLTVMTLIPSYDGKISRAHRILAQADPTNMELRRAADDLVFLLKQYPNDPQVAEAETLVEELNVRQLLRLAEGGRVVSRDPATRAFVKAYQSAVSEKYFAAMQGYRELKLKGIESKEQGYIVREATRQLEQVQKLFLQQAQLKLAAAEEEDDRTTASVWAADIKRAFGSLEEHAEWIAELTEKFPEITGIDPWPPQTPTEPSADPTIADTESESSEPEPEKSENAQSQSDDRLQSQSVMETANEH